ncbi:hypothetical protein [Metaplanococcus flavidus]|uniref:Uncharacterized protein n=1 Tax=Metaplanococcus flavidus TaxID=569883 RepID=A0ABW3L8A5_9BACL
MRNSTMVALFVSLFLLLGFPMIFMILTMFTDQWIYLVFGSVPSIMTGTAGIYFILQHSRKTGTAEDTALEGPRNDETFK